MKELEDENRRLKKIYAEKWLKSEFRKVAPEAVQTADLCHVCMR